MPQRPRALVIGAAPPYSGRMNESEYQRRADDVFKRVQDLFEDVDPDLADAYSAGDVVTVTFADRSRCVINTQRATHQIWMAYSASAWHFRHDPAADRWEDDKGRGDELFATLAAIVREAAGVELPLARR